MTEPTGSTTKTKKWYIGVGALVVALLAFVANVDGTISFFERLFGKDKAVTGTADSGAAAPGANTTMPTPTGAGGPSSAPAVTTPSPTAVDRDSTITEPSPRITEGWFDLTAYDSVAFGNGHRSVNSVKIGEADYPNSIRGYYQSSASDPNNRRTWLVGGKCTRLSVWVGKDQASSENAGTGRFIVKIEDVERRAVEATMTDAPQHIELDITGAVRLTLFDTRGGRDAYNAWGSPRVYCTAPPGKAK
ncbi:NPCBM/NEW2 domain-containing protein [Micromonospora sp. LOL_025]|uniref:NPCBM/NEW2 domain-containing protein n=1 Tax=Micromonospora sp. LOL_025 TaxID=3345413 RepID=UPI003A85352A